MRQWLLSCALVAGCGYQRHITTVDVAVLPSTQSATGDGTLLGECRIVGSGERRLYTKQAPQFTVFASREATAPSLVIAEPRDVHVTWSNFPQHIDKDHARARIAIGGQEHIRFTGYALTRGRTFSLKTRMYAEPGHLWARAGAPIEMLAAEGSVAITRVETSLVAPKELTLRGTCASVVYEPEEPQHPSPKARENTKTMLMTGTSIDLYASPQEQRSFTTLVAESSESLALEGLDTRDGFVRVAADVDDVGFDAWVPSSQVEETAEVMGGLGLGGFGTSSSGGRSYSEHGTVVRDAPLFVGSEPKAMRDAVVEKNADVYFWTTQGVKVDGKLLVPFEFVDGQIRAPGDERFWIAKTALVEK